MPKTLRRPILESSLWNEADAQFFIDDYCLYDEDVARFSVESVVNGLREPYTHSFEVLYSGPQYIYPVFPDVPTRDEANLLFENLTDLIRKRTHPFEHTIETFSKPRDLFEATAFVIHQGTKAYDQEYDDRTPRIYGAFCTGPNGKLDVSEANNGSIYTTNKGAYSIGSFCGRRSLEQTLFIQHVDGTYTCGEDVFPFLLEDLDFCRAFSISVNRSHDFLEIIVDAYEKAFSKATGSVNFNSEHAPWRPLYRKPMEELCDESGFIPYRGLSYESPLTSFPPNCHLYLLDKSYSLPLNDEQQIRYAIHLQQGLIDRYELAEVFYRGDIDLFDVMCDRNDKFYEQVRAVHKNENLEEFGVLGIFNEKTENLIVKLNEQGYLDRDILRNLADMKFKPPTEKEQRASNLLQPYEFNCEFYASRQGGRAR